MKVCTKCKVEKQKAEFSRSKKVKDGLQYRCKACDLEYQSANKEAIAAYQREHFESNKQAIAAKKREYRAANPDKGAAYERNRRAIKRASEGSHTAADVKYIFDLQRGLCASCTNKLFKSGKNRYHVDHIKPLAKGGSNDKYNLQCLCRACNLKKAAKDPNDWAKENGKLL